MVVVLLRCWRLFKEAFFETLVTGHADEQEAQQLAAVLAPLVTPGFGKEAEVERGWSVGGLGFGCVFFCLRQTSSFKSFKFCNAHFS